MYLFNLSFIILCVTHTLFILLFYFFHIA